MNSLPKVITLYHTGKEKVDKGYAVYVLLEPEEFRYGVLETGLDYETSRGVVDSLQNHRGEVVCKDEVYIFNHTIFPSKESCRGYLKKVQEVVDRK